MVTVTVEWLKDGAEGDEIVSRLEVVEVGTDEDGEPITSCTVEPADGGGAPTAARRVKLPDSAKIALGQLQKLVSEHGEPSSASNHIPSDASVVPVELWRNYCELAGMTCG